MGLVQDIGTINAAENGGPSRVSQALAPSVRARLSRGLIGAIILLGLLDAWAGRRSYFAGDSVSYMDMAAQIAQGHWKQAVNGLWSPLFPMILALPIHPVLHNVALEFAVVRCVNFLIFLGTLFAFRFFLKTFLLAWRDAQSTDRACVSEVACKGLELAAWALFIWACFSLNMVCRVSPDTCVMAILFLSFGKLLTLQSGKVGRVDFLLFGVILGVGYWFKAILFPFSFLFLIAALGCSAVRRVKYRLLLGLLAFGLVASPLVIALSVHCGHLTFGESGGLNYAWHVNGVQHWSHWQGGPPGSGTPIHPTTQIHAHPDAFAFGTPILATYPPWYDPSYWYDGVTPRFNFPQQLHAAATNLKVLASLLLHSVTFGIVLSLFLLSIGIQRKRRVITDHLRTFGSLWFVILGCIGIYSLVHIESRYLAAPLAAAGLLLLSMASPALLNRRSIWMILPAMCLLAVVVETGPRLASAARLLVHNRGDVRDGRWRIADEFGRLGVPEGTPVASIGEACFSDWARLAHLRVVAEIPLTNNERPTGEVDRFWASPAKTQHEVLSAFTNAGARLVVASQVPSWANTREWKHIGDSEYYYRELWPSDDQSLPRSE